jgi:uncharacterized damage-inducible protein DinB
VASNDDWYVHYVAKVSHAHLAETVQFTFTDGGEGSMTREEILMHLITHGAYHRGSLAHAIKGIAMAPPSDSLTKFLQLSLHESQDLF